MGATNIEPEGLEVQIIDNFSTPISDRTDNGRTFLNLFGLDNFNQTGGAVPDELVDYNNPNIIDEENYGKRPKPFNNNDPSSYPSDRDQRQRISSWDLILDTTIKSGTAREKKEMRKYLRDKYKDPNQRKYFSEKEKRFISAYKPPEVTIPKVDTTILTQNFKPIEQTIEDKIREQQFQKMLEDQRRAKAERQGGLAYLLGIDE